MNPFDTLKTLIPPLKGDKLVEIDKNSPKYIPYRINQLISAAILANINVTFTINDDNMLPTTISLIDGEYRHVGDMSPIRRKKILNAIVTHGEYGESKNEYAAHYIITAKIDGPEY